MTRRLQVLTFALTALVGTSASAAVDPLCGQVITSDLTLTHDVDCISYVGNAITIGADNVTIDGAGFKIMAPDADAAIYAANRSNITIRNVDVSGWCNGAGIHLATSSNATIENVRVDARENGVRLTGATTPTIVGLVSDGAGHRALSIEGLTGLPTLSGLVLENATIGLYLSSSTVPLTLDDDAITSVAGSITGLQLETVSNLTVRDLALDNPTAGINAFSSGNTNLVFRDLDLSGRGSAGSAGGTGLFLMGSGHTIQNITANDRQNGTWVQSFTNLTISGFTARRGGTSALTLFGSTLGPTNTLSLAGLALHDSVTGLALQQIIAPAGTPFSLTPAIGSMTGNRYGLRIAQSRYLDVTGWTPANLGGVNVAIWANDSSNQNLRFTDLDLSSQSSLSGTLENTGLYLAGPNNLVDDVIANGRRRGVWLNHSSLVNAVVSNISANHAETALMISDVALSPTNTLTVSNVSCSSCIAALDISNLDGQVGSPWVINSSVLSAYSDVWTPIRIRGGSTNLLVKGAPGSPWVLSGRENGLDADDASNANLTFEYLDVSGPGYGTGLRIRGPNHVARNIVANDRRVGVYAVQVPNLTLDQVAADHAQYAGITLESTTGTAPTLTALALTNSARGLDLHSFSTTTPLSLNPSTFASLAGNFTAIQLRGTSTTNVRIEDLTLAQRRAIRIEGAGSGIVLEDLNLDGVGLGWGVDATLTPNLTLRRVSASNRNIGISGFTMSGLVLDTVTVNDSRIGLGFYSFPVGGTSPSITGLDFRRNDTAIDISSSNTLVLGPALPADRATALNVAGSRIGLSIQQSRNLTARNLRLDAAEFGLSSDTRGNDNVVLQGLDATGTGQGTGIAAGGRDIQVIDCDVSDRRTGLHLSNHHRGNITNLAARSTSVGLQVAGGNHQGYSPYLPLTLSNIDVSDSATGLSLTWAGSPWTLDNATVALNATRTLTGIELTGASNVTLDGFVLPSVATGFRARSGSNVVIRNTDVSGQGLGVGIDANLSGLTLENVTANDRAIGVDLSSAPSPTVNGLTARHTATGLRLANNTGTLTLTNLTLEDAAPGLEISNHAGTLAINGGVGQEITSLAGAHPAITVTSSPNVTVDAAGLLLTGPSAGSWFTTLPANSGPEAALCGTTVTASVTLTGDLDCSGVTGTALTLGAGVDFNGAGFDLIAPHATTVVALPDTGSTLRNIDLSGTRPTGTAVYVTGQDTTLTAVTANRRHQGFVLNNPRNAVITNVSAAFVRQNAMEIYGLTGQPLSLAGVSLTDSGTGLSVTHSGANADPGGGDLRLDPASFTSLARNATSIALNASNLVIEDLVLDGWTSGLTGGGSDFVIDDLDVSSAFLTGAGLVLSGTSHDVSDIIASRRTIGVSFGGLAGWTVASIVATDNNTGLAIAGDLGAGAPIFAGLDLRRNELGLSMDYSTGPFTLTDSQFVMPVDGRRGNLTDLRLGFQSNGLTVDTMTVAGLSTGILVSSGAHVLSNVSASSEARGGVGIRASASTTLIDVSVSGYNAGILNEAGTLIATSVALDRATGAGLQLSQPGAAAYQVSDLSVTRSANGIYLDGTPAGSGVDIVGPGVGATPAAGRIIIDTLTDNETDITLRNITDVVVRDLDLSGTTTGLEASHANAMNGLVVRNVTSTPPMPSGNGISIGGNDQVVENYQASYRDYGLHIAGGVGHDLDDLVFDKCASYGVSVANSTTTASSPLTLNDIAVSRTGGGSNPAAIRFEAVNNAASPVTLDPAHGIALTDNMVDLRFSNSRHVTVENLALAGWSVAISANSPTNQNLTFSNLDLRGPFAFGTGLELSGANHVVDILDASRRATGVSVDTGTTGLVVRDLVADLSLDAGFSYRSVAPPVELDGISAKNGRIGLRFGSISGPWTLSPAMLGTLDLTGVWTDVSLENVSNVTVENFALRGLSLGLTVTGSSSGVAMRNLTSIPPSPGGDGFQLVGANHTADNLEARLRRYGLYLGGTTGVVVTGFTSLGSNVGLLIENQTTMPTLSNLTLEDGSAAIQLGNVRGTSTTRLVMDGAAMGALSFAGTSQSLLVGSQSRFLDVKNLDLPGSTVGVNLTSDTTEIGLSGLDASRGAEAGKLWCSSIVSSTGVSLSGSGHRLSDITTVGRRLGVYADGASDIEMDGGLIAASTNHGLLLAGTPSLANTTVSVNVANTATTFQVALGTGLSIVGRRVVVGLGGGPEVRRVVSLGGGNMLTLDAPLSSIPPAGTSVVAYELANATPRLTVTDTDVCANRTAGAGVGNAPAILSGNYWRTNLGPVHTSNPGGTGDIVTGTGTSLSDFELVPFDVVNPYCNAEPVPDAGPDRTICEGDAVVLDGSVSFDPDGEPLTYVWTQTVGTGVTMADPNAAVAGFTAPAPADGAPPVGPMEALTFVLEVDDNDQVRSDSVVLTVQPRHLEPTSVAAGDIGGAEGTTLSLDGTGSSDPEGETLTYAWVQVSGPTVVNLTGANTASPVFEAPAIGVDGDPYYTEVVTFELTVTDEIPDDYCGDALSDTSTIEVEIYNMNTPAVADAGPDQSVDEEATVTLDGSSSFDPDGDTFSYSWFQIAGSSVTLSGDDTANPTFTAPELVSGSEVLVFSLCVNDPWDEGASCDEVEITVSSTCTPTGLPETVCNGVDDDCDDDIDEDYVQDDSCFLQGPCAASNVASSCVGGVETVCQTGTPGIETCDNVDNDCDGPIDEDLTQPTTCGQGACENNVGEETCIFGTWSNDTCDPFAGATAETCDNTDNDCDGTIDEDLTQPTSCGQGACQNNVGEETCFAGTWSNDTCDPLSGATAESCDNVDNDCDGQIDEDLTQPTTCGQGACENNVGEETCVLGDWVNDTCDPLSGATAESCDNVDNDCDGDIDEDLASDIVPCVFVGGCEGTVETTCQGGQMVEVGECQIPDGILDLCDNIDDDCDGQTDEDFAPEPAACGVDACAVGQGLTTCIGGVLGDTCEPLWSEIPDTTCGSGTTGQHVAYILVTDATGTLIGSVRCYQDLSAPNTPVTCDTDPTGILIVYPELYCEGVAP